MPYPRLLGPGLLLALLLPVAACDSAEAPEDHDLIVSGVNLTRLFAPPTPSEIQAVRTDWASRSPDARDVAIVAEGTDAEGARLVVVAHTMTDPHGSAFTHYGVVRLPGGAADRPVLVVHHGGIRLAGDNPNGTVAGMVDAYPALFDQTVQVFPVYRSEPLGTAGVQGLGATYTAGGAPSPWDYDVDDSLTLLDAALALFPDETDAGRIGALGFSRGATVALLMAVRDDRVDAVTAYFGPTDFFDPTIQQLAAGLLVGSPAALNLPGAAYLRDAVLQPLAAGALSYGDARLEAVRRSASLFTAALPALQVHHHADDPVVPFAQAEALDAAVATTPNGGVYDYNPYTGALPSGVTSAHTPLAMPESLPDTEAFFQAHLIGSGVLAAWPTY